METTRALLMRLTRFGDTSLIVTWFSADFGKLKTMAKGARGAKSAMQGRLDLFFDVEIGFVRSRKSDLHSLREVAVRDGRSLLRTAYENVQAASYFVQLLELVTETDAPAAELFDLLERALRHLDKEPASRKAVAHFEKELAHLIGVGSRDNAALAIRQAYGRLPALRETVWSGLS